MDKFLDELTIEDLKGETQELAETIGLDAFKRLVQAYNGTGRLYIPQLSRITAPSETAIFMKTTNTEVLMFPNLL